MNPLRLIYFSKTNCLHFASEEFQSVVIKVPDILHLVHFSIMELESCKLNPADDLIGNFSSFYDMIQESEDSLRFPGFYAGFSNGIEITGDSNLTFLSHKEPDSLFEFCRQIFETLGLDMITCKSNLMDHHDKLLQFPLATKYSAPDINGWQEENERPF